MSLRQLVCEQVPIMKMRCVYAFDRGQRHYEKMHLYCNCSFNYVPFICSWSICDALKRHRVVYDLTTNFDCNKCVRSIHLYISYVLNFWLLWGIYIFIHICVFVSVFCIFIWCVYPDTTFAIQPPDFGSKIVFKFLHFDKIVI